MIEFDQERAVVLSMAGPMILVFCTLLCKLNYHNGAVRYSPVADKHLYGCWQCGTDLLQGLAVDAEEGDSSVLRTRRERE